jgi:hypothetical protein
VKVEGKSYCPADAERQFGIRASTQVVRRVPPSGLGDPTEDLDDEPLRDPLVGTVTFGLIRLALLGLVLAGFLLFVALRGATTTTGAENLADNIVGLAAIAAVGLFVLMLLAGRLILDRSRYGVRLGLVVSGVSIAGFVFVAATSGDYAFLYEAVLFGVVFVLLIALWARSH